MAENYGDVYSIATTLDMYTKHLCEIEVLGLATIQSTLISARLIGKYYVVTDEDTPNNFGRAQLRRQTEVVPFLVRAMYKGEMYYIFSNEKEYPTWIKMK